MKTIIEAGHFYKVNGPSLLSMQGWQIGKELQAESGDAEMALFVDDYHMEQSFFDPSDKFLKGEEALEATATMTKEADHVFSEADLYGHALEKVGPIIDSGLSKRRNDVLSVSGIRLGAIEPNPGIFVPTCVLLDYVLLEQKAALGGDQVVVLPDMYKKQQAQLATILGKLTLPNLTSYKCIFYNSDPSSATEEIYL